MPLSSPLNSRDDAPFVGNGFTRWVDGQFAFDQPELGLSNWEYGRILGRGAILSGDSVFTVRYRAHVEDPETRTILPRKRETCTSMTLVWGSKW